MAASSHRGPRILYGFAGLVLVVVLAWYAGELLLDQSRSQHASAMDLLGDGGSKPTEVDQLADQPAPGWGRVILGAPSGAPRRERPEPESGGLPDGGQGDRSTNQPGDPPGDLGPGVEAPPPVVQPPPRWPADLELTVRPGQSLSKIVAQSYGRSTDDLVQRLATYNGLSNPDRLRAGQALRVPVREKLLASTPEL
ncbi:MAG: LysM domain-containing protein [Planctomycetota bacterium]|nr:LysM domain-containing protein [Planctomycetota bacterium]